MGVVQAPGELDGHIQHPFERLLMSALIQLLVFDPVLQTAAFHVLGEHSRDAAQHPHIVAADDVRMQPQPDPRQALPDEVLLVNLRGKELRPRALDRHVHVPITLVDTVDQAHAAAIVDLLDLVQVQDHVADVPIGGDVLLIGKDGRGVLFVRSPRRNHRLHRFQGACLRRHRGTGPGRDHRHRR